MSKGRPHHFNVGPAIFFHCHSVADTIKRFGDLTASISSPVHRIGGFFQGRFRDGSGKGKMLVSDSTHPRQSPYERKLELVQIGSVF
ncbi:hypothetical protein AAC387_Pa04g0443 [Persea americana]